MSRPAARWPPSLLRREHAAEGTRSEAFYSACEAYRYLLLREWGEGPRILWIMLNPSTADERRNDPTIERCQRRARAWGCGAMGIANLFAFRATRPAALKAAADPQGGDNAIAIEAALGWLAGGMVLCAWGVHGGHLGRGAALAAQLAARGQQLHALGLTKEGHPRHPLYLPYSARPAPWVPGTVAA
ncbi:DUF1643 domain-containing protein [Pseudoroseicyclus tamaricis]|uniref:DUF1643 domain-containing protein n=1 Tax=Pseudoroseicyclus tamaricis TaxID=2705421 RepID=A0A6B2JP78_9RHOB|nr:DUF1643 domain-containing protein [Pseudoroseicyclus tamaricis]NDU99744.1 DUF1643 domain-containing protein [Pseudoroseicyclus tamaricis]